MFWGSAQYIYNKNYIFCSFDVSDWPVFGPFYCTATLFIDIDSGFQDDFFAAAKNKFGDWKK